jgi:hypothetical protein
MADGKTFEYGSSASEVQFQDEIGKVKNRQGEACIEITDDQDVGIGTATPRRKLDILDAGDPQLRVSQADNSVYADVEAKSTGGVHITPTGGTYAGHTFLKSASTSSYLVVQNSSTGTSDDRGKGLSMGVGANVAYIWMRGTGSNGTLNIGAGGSGGLTIDADNDIVALEGSFQLKAEIAAPSAPASGEGGIFYVKSDGIPYFISDTTAETSLVGGGGGSSALTMTAVSFGVDGATYSATTYDTMYLVTTTGGAVEVDLPTAGSQAGKTIDILAATGATNSVTVDPNGSETINGSGTSLTLSSNYQNVTLISDGTNWVIR